MQYPTLIIEDNTQSYGAGVWLHDCLTAVYPRNKIAFGGNHRQPSQKKWSWGGGATGLRGKGNVRSTSFDMPVRQPLALVDKASDSRVTRNWGGGVLASHERLQLTGWKIEKSDIQHLYNRCKWQTLLLSPFGMLEVITISVFHCNSNFHRILLILGDALLRPDFTRAQRVSKSVSWLGHVNRACIEQCWILRFWWSWEYQD